MGARICQDRDEPVFAVQRTPFRFAHGLTVAFGGATNFPTFGRAFDRDVPKSHSDVPGERRFA
jgi:hypothetical protein